MAKPHIPTYASGYSPRWSRWYSLYLAGEKFKVFRCLDGSSHQGFHFLLQALEIFWIIIIYHFLFLSFLQQRYTFFPTLNHSFFIFFISL